MTVPAPTWIEVAADSDFSIHNLPYGMARGPGGPLALTALGPFALNLDALQALGHLDGLGLPPGIFARPALNDFIALGRPAWQALRQRLQQVLSVGSDLHNDPAQQAQVCLPLESVELEMPVQVGDYSDFYASEYHAFNVGSMFRGPENALPPNWKHLPIGYHGRASSVVVSGTPVRRPWGQSRPGEESPRFAPSARLDFELELAAVVGVGNALGQPVPVSGAWDHIFGFVLLNDWSARDIQQWEYVPLGPFLGKNFATSISPWIVTAEALAPFRRPGLAQEPPVLPYLQDPGPSALDIQLEVSLDLPGFPPQRICRSNARHLYWSFAQQLAHHSCGGCNLRVGDLIASGTISGPEPDSYGSLLELAWRGSRPLPMPDGSTRSFLEDGDTLVMRGYAQQGGIRVGFGELIGEILPAWPA